MPMRAAIFNPRQGMPATPRASATARGYSHRWTLYAAQYRKGHPLCVACKAEGVITPTHAVDHIKPHRGNMVLFWDTTNHQPLCKHHHDQKTASEDGGFGNAIKS